MAENRELDIQVATEIFGYPVEERGGYWTGDKFMEVQSDPLYASHSAQEICILVESKPFSDSEIETYKRLGPSVIPTMHEEWVPLPRYSSDMTTAMIAADKLIAEGWHFVLQTSRFKAGRWLCTFWYDIDAYDALADTPEVAICEAGLEVRRQGQNIGKENHATRK